MPSHRHIHHAFPGLHFEVWWLTSRAAWLFSVYVPVRTQAVDVCLQKRLPSAEEWRNNVREAKERHGAAGVPSEERRVSPIVELSLLLVEPPLPFPLSFVAPHMLAGFHDLISCASSLSMQQ